MTDRVAPIPSHARGGWSPFRRFTNLRLVVKLPLVISLLTIIVAVVLTLTALYDARLILEDEIEARFNGALEDRRGATQSLLREIETDLVSQVENPTVKAAMASFSLSWAALDGDPGQVLQRDYIQENPNPAGRRDELVRTGKSSQYDLVHTKYHPFFRSLVRAKGLYDIFLVTPEGDVVYSAFKKPDFATNLASGRWRDTDLARVWREAGTLPQGETAFSDYTEYAPSDGSAGSFLATPITNGNGNRIGIMVIQLPAGRMSSITSNLDALGGTGLVYIVGQDGRLRTNSNFEGGPEMLDPIALNAPIKAALRGENANFVLETGLRGSEVRLSARPVEFHDQTWAVVIEEADEELFAPITEMRNLLGLQAAGLSAVIALLGMFFARAISRPISDVGTALTRVSQNDYTTAIPHLSRGDDAGELARNLDGLRDKLADAEAARAQQNRKAAEQRDVVEQLSTGIGKLAQGDLTVRLQSRFAEEYEGLRTAFNGAIAKLNDTMAGLLLATKQIDTNAHDVESASNELSQKAIEQAASLEQTAAAITQLSASVKSTADAAGEADKVMSSAKADAESSGREVNRAMTAMDQIATSSQKITQVTSVIEDLAFQTNLLALNAGVEAARAGEAGRGFAVVASEVRALAQRSSDAAKEINGLIQESADNVTNGVDLVEKAGKSFENLILDFEKVSASVSSIAMAAREQSVGLSEINTAVDQLDGVTQKNAAVATEVHGTGKIMVNEAIKLNRIASHFRIDPNAPSASAAAPTVAEARPAAAPAAAAPARAVANGGPIMSAGDVADDVWAEF